MSETNEQSKKKAEEDLIAGIPAAAFDAQVLLLDAFIGNLKAANVEIYNGEAVTDFAKNVPFAISAAKTINNLTYSNQQNIAKVQKYVDEVRPVEIAQMLPDIQLEIVDGTTYETIFVVPLADPGVIQDGFSAPGYYSTKTVGLKSLELFLDGSDNPFFGRAYNVNMELVFDSVNTFFNKAVGSNLTYAQIFRSAGRVASGDYFTRLTLGMSSQNLNSEMSLANPDVSIEQKYNLKDPVMTLLLNLQLVNTKIKIDQNLKTTVNVSYISQEEGMFKSQEVFDFLGLDLAAAKADLKEQIEGAKKEKLALEEAARLRQQEKIDDKKAELEAAKAKEEALQREYQKIKSLQRKELVAEFGSSAPEDGGSYEYKGTILMERPAGAIKSYFTGDDTTREQVDYGEAEEISIEKLGEAQKAIEALEKAVKEESDKDARKEFEKEFGEKSFKEIEEKLEAAKNKFANVRLDQITAAVDAILNDPNLYIGNEPAIRTISLESQEIKDYYFQGSNVGYKSVKTKELGTKPKGTSKPFNAGNPNTKTKPQAKEEIKSRNKGGFGGFFGPQSKGANKEKAKKGQNSKTLAGVDNIIASLSDQKNIQYILLGDFIRLLMRRIYAIRTAQIIKGQVNQFFGGSKKPIDKQKQYKAILDKSSVLLSQIRFKNMESKNTDIVKNIYSIPISVAHITHIIAKHTFGKSKNFFYNL